MTDKEIENNTSKTSQEQEDLNIIKKYNLPSEKELIQELGPYDSEEKGLIKTLINGLLSKSLKFTGFLEEMLHPDSTIVSMQESSMFSNEEREKMFDLFRELTLFQRKSLLIILSITEEEKAIYFKEFYAFFISKKDILKQLVEQAITVWSIKEYPKTTNEGYFG